MNDAPQPIDRPLLLRRIGYWSTGLGESRGLPNPHDFVDPDWDEDDRKVVESYLDNGTYFRGYMGLSPCRICGKNNGSGELTDGVLAWPEGLAHYVSEHAVRPPPVIEDYILRRADRVESATADDSWWANGAPEPITVGEPPLDPVERLAWRGNMQLLQDPLRRFPGMLVQGDTLSTHVDGEESAELLARYEEMMGSLSLELPYRGVPEVSESPVEALEPVVEELRALVDAFGDATPDQMTAHFYLHAFNECDGAIRALLRAWDQRSAGIPAAQGE